MGETYGRITVGGFGRSISVLANPDDAKWKIGGGTFDWASVAAVAGAPVNLEDGVTIEIGQKYLRYGAVVIIAGDGELELADDTDTLVRGETFLIERTIVMDTTPHSKHFGVLEGGGVFTARLAVGGAGQPTLANLRAAMPLLTFARN